MGQRAQAQRARLAHRLFFPPHDQAMALRTFQRLRKVLTAAG
jgi:hypothetical protein